MNDTNPIAGGPPMALSHLYESGRARMVDVTEKASTHREATACARILMRPETLRLIQEGRVTKGDVLAVAQVAGIMGAKRTPDLVPLCHPLPITGVDMVFHLDEQSASVEVRATVRVTALTGVEMEALMAVCVAALTIYDMCKAVDRGMTISDVQLLRKIGGKSGEFVRPEEEGTRRETGGERDAGTPGHGDADMETRT
jgi:cyclic pyranopterin phosphate synthase